MDAEQYYQSIQQDLPADPATLQGWKQEKRNDNEWGTEEDLLWEVTWKGTMDAFLEAAAETYPPPPTPRRCISSRPRTSSSPIANTTSDTPYKRRGPPRPTCTRGQHERTSDTPLKPVRTPVAIFGSLGVCIYVPASRYWLISYSPIHLT